MCLLPGYFEDRNKELEKFHRDGYIEISELEKQYGISLNQLRNAGMVTDKLFTGTTADIHSFRLTGKGRLYFIEGPHQLILLDPAKADSLIAKTKNRSRKYTKRSWFEWEMGMSLTFFFILLGITVLRYS